MFGSGELRLGCFAMTEPASGCDIENLARLHGRPIQTKAVLDGDEWVINGAKRFPSNAGVADIYCVVCQTDPNLGEEGIALIYVPSPREGLSFGKFESKAGMQADRNCDIYFDNVRVPRQYRAAGPGDDARLMKRNLTVGRVASAAMAVGNARGGLRTRPRLHRLTGGPGTADPPALDVRRDACGHGDRNRDGAGILPADRLHARPP